VKARGVLSNNLLFLAVIHCLFQRDSAILSSNTYASGERMMSKEKARDIAVVLCGRFVLDLENIAYLLLLCVPRLAWSCGTGQGRGKGMPCSVKMECGWSDPEIPVCRPSRACNK
jgi:hypothetical protein